MIGAAPGNQAAVAAGCGALRAGWGSTIGFWKCLQRAFKSQHNRAAGDGVVDNNQGPRGQSLEKHGDNLRLGDWILPACAAPERKRRGRIFGCSQHSIPIASCQQEHRSTRNAFYWYRRHVREDRQACSAADVAVHRTLSMTGSDTLRAGWSKRMPRGLASSPYCCDVNWPATGRSLSSSARNPLHWRSYGEPYPAQREADQYSRLSRNLCQQRADSRECLRTFSSCLAL